MIEHCPDLASCESVLQEAASRVQLLGEIPLTDEDVTHLTELVRVEVVGNVSRATQRLTRSAPTAFALFLTWKGILDYEDGSYWPAVETSVGRLDVNWRSRWGQAFQGFLRQRGLPTFEMEGAHAYVTPILTHGGIPNSCLEEYFERVVRPLVRRELMDPTDPEEIHYILDEWRSTNAERFDLDERERSLQLLIKKSGAHPQDTPQSPMPSEESVEVIQAAMEALDKKREELIRIRDAFTDEDRTVIGMGGEMDELTLREPGVRELRDKELGLREQESGLLGGIGELWVTLSDEPWSPQYGATMQLLSMEALSIEFDRLERESLPAGSSSASTVIETIPPHNPRPRIQQVAAVGAVLLGLGIAVGGFLTGTSAPLAIGLVLAIMGAGAFWWLRGSRHKPEASLAPSDPTPLLVEGLRQEPDPAREIVRLAQGLPLSENKIKRSGRQGYMDLVRLAPLVALLAEVQADLAHCMAEIESYRAVLSQTASAIGIDGNRDDHEVLQDLAERHKLALESETAATNARETLLQDVAAEEASLQAQLSQVDAQAPADRGDLPPQQLPLPSDGGHPADLKSLFTQSGTPDETRSLVEEELSRVQGELSSLPRILPGIDEPIRRYILYAGEPAEAFLVGSVRLLHDSRVSGGIPDQMQVHLPERVLSSFESWWTAQGAAQEMLADEDGGISRQTRLAPAIFLDPHVREVRFRMRPQIVAREAAESAVALEVSGDGLASQARRHELRLYASDSGEAETQELDAVLPFPAAGYTFRLLAGSETLNTWEVPTPGIGRVYLAFSHRTGRILRDPTLPKERVWLLLQADHFPEPLSCVLVEGGSMPAGWHEYRLYDVDLAQVDRLVLVHRKRGRVAELDVAYGEPPGIDFTDLAPLVGVRLVGLDTYVGSLPALQISVGPATSLRHWRLSVHPGNSSSLLRRKHLRLDELGAALSHEEASGGAVINLAHESLLGSDAVGEFHIRLHRRPYSDWRRSLCVVRCLEVEFKRPFYLPSPPGEPPAVKAEIFCEPLANVSVDAPGRLIHGDGGRALVQADPRTGYLHGKLTYRAEAGGFSFPLEIDLPKVRWRLHGASDPDLASWQDEMREVWMGSPIGEVSLLVHVPPRLEEWHLSLRIADRPAKRLEACVRDGIASFDLRELAEVLQTGPPVRSIVLEIRDRDRQPVVQEAPLLSARIRWEATEVECVQDVQGEEVILSMTWTELGKATEKEVRLWSLSADVSASPIASQQVPAAARAARLILRTSDLRAGEYLLAISPIQAWKATVPRRPSPSDPGTLRIRIAAGTELRKGETFLIESVQDGRGQVRSLAARYRLRISGKILNRQMPSQEKVPSQEKGGRVLVTSANEGWFAAVLDVGTGFDPRDEEAARFVAEIETGDPYKLDYDPEGHALRAIEDRYGEGAMYCHDCHMLYWDASRLETEQRRLKHSLDGPIERFAIRPGR